MLNGYRFLKFTKLNVCGKPHQVTDKIISSPLGGWSSSITYSMTTWNSSLLQKLVAANIKNNYPPFTSTRLTDHTIIFSKFTTYITLVKMYLNFFYTDYYIINIHSFNIESNLFDVLYPWEIQYSQISSCA